MFSLSEKLAELLGFNQTIGESLREIYQNDMAQPVGSGKGQPQTARDRNLAALSRYSRGLSEIKRHGINPTMLAGEARFIIRENTRRESLSF